MNYSGYNCPEKIVVQPLIILRFDVQKVYNTLVNTKKYILQSVHNLTVLYTAANRSHVDLVIQIDTIHSFSSTISTTPGIVPETYIKHNNEKAITSNIIIPDIKLFNRFFFNVRKFSF